jgi:hypothetical protein
MEMKRITYPLRCHSARVRLPTFPFYLTLTNLPYDNMIFKSLYFIIINLLNYEVLSLF